MVYPLHHAFHLFKFWRNSARNSYFKDFFRKVLNPFSPVEHSFCHILGMVCKTKRKWVNWMLHWLGYFDLDLDLWPWIFKVRLYLGNGRPNCHGTKGTGVDRMPWCETLRKWVNLTLCWLGYFDLDLWPWIFKSNCVLGMGSLIVMEQRGQELRMPWCETLRKWVNRMLRWLGYLWPLPLTLNFQGQIVSREWEAWLSWNERDGSW